MERHLTDRARNYQTHSLISHRIKKKKMFCLTQTVHKHRNRHQHVTTAALKKKKKKKLSSTSYCPSYQTEGTSRSLWWGETSSTCEVKASSPCDDSWKEKQFQEGETGLCPRHAALPAHQNRFLGGTSWPFRGLTA